MILDYKNAFSDNVKSILDNLDFDAEIEKLFKTKKLEFIIKEFSTLDLSNDSVSNHEMGYIFEDLIRRFSQNAEAGDHYTAREIIKLMVNVLLDSDKEEIKNKDLPMIKCYDGTCGTGGMISSSYDFINLLNPNREVYLYGQEINPESYAICKADMIIKGQEENIALGNTLTEDKFKNDKFDYIFMNPPFGITWKDYSKEIIEEFEKGSLGRFEGGLPAQSDGALLFMQHMISKLTDNGRGAIVLNASPLFSGGAGSGESNIRKWMLDKDYLETIISLPSDMFYNTSINTYIFIIDKQKGIKNPKRKGKVQLIDGSQFFVKLRKSLGSKKNELSEQNIEDITNLYHSFEENEYSKIFDNEDFMYRQITIERPLRLDFVISEERLEKLISDNAFLKKPEAYREVIINKLKEYISENIYTDREVFIKHLSEVVFKDTDCIKDKKGKIVLKDIKIIVNALSERNEKASPCKNTKGEIETDSTLRDTETVPYKENINDYFHREVRPHVKDAWIDETKTKEGAEIPFTRHFYKYEKLRSFKECMDDVKRLNKEIEEIFSSLDI